MLAKKIVAYFESKGGTQGKTLALWGLAFKANTDDVREAASIKIINELVSKGIKVRAFDPVAGRKLKPHYQDDENVTIVGEQYEALESADALAVVTEWNQFRSPDFERIKRMLQQPLVFDGRNLYSPQLMKELGFVYYCVGRSEPATA